ncbi:hypothetical protein DOM22_12505 [Bdellovibrio sp. ZAP7]|uniref:hypothetical protein n=1 Tax=Bdellovibrio sp. ZAP7 TaxID=2231053 RepID=UPI0011588C9E|nr:hypothetical protein [Bdellovibrio sp. ZAP7]QDK45912.1 hypothetical protein DOM22_12505 [Bdellovibrio sp. ZAP7]
MKNILHSIVLIALIPLIALALEPTNPPGICDRFVGEKDAEQCREKVQKNENVDWYAVTVCNLQKDDSQFWKCWDSIQGQSYNPQALEKCGEEKELSDTQRFECVSTARSDRKPASQQANFQPLTIKKTK